ncbi:MAG: NADH-quinone oxidoreductase subunit H, partial [Gemmatimonadota bacterium]
WDLPGTWDDAFLVNGEWIRGFTEAGAPIAAELAWWKTLLTFGSFAAKTAFFMLVYIWVRWTVPRFRYDQVMQLGWKVMLPTALAYIMVVAATVLALDSLEVAYGFTFGLVLTGVSALCTGFFLFVLDRGRILSGSSANARDRFRAQALESGRDAGAVSAGD